MSIPLSRHILSRHPLARDITPVIVLKLVCIVLASIYLFPASARPHVSPDIIAQKIFALSSPAGSGAAHDR